VLCLLSTRDFFATSAYYCADSNGNPYAVVKSSDYIPPITTIHYFVIPSTSTGNIYLMQASSISLTAVDPLLSTVPASGVAATYYSVDSPNYLTYTQSFQLSEGQHSVSYYSRDKAGNNESPKSVMLFVDGTPPQSAIHVSGYADDSLANNMSLSAGAAISFTAQDPQSNGVASGVSRILVQIDTAPVFAFTGSVVLPNGFHQINFLAVDNAENAETPNLLQAFWGVPVDTQPPTTTASFVGPRQEALSEPVLSSGTSIVLAAVDNPIDGYAVGVSSTYYLLDVSTASCLGGPQTALPDFTQPPGTCANPLYPGPVVVSTAGAHVLYFFSIDRAGNQEQVNVLPFKVAAVSLPGASGTGGLGIGVDNASLLWPITYVNGTVVLSHTDINGVVQSSATLSNADPAFPWSVFFDTAGNPYAIGSALAANGADQVAVYRSSPQSASIVSSVTFDSGFNNNNLVMGVASPGWIVGSVQTQGPIAGGQNAVYSYSLAIWRFNPTTGLIQLTTAYTRAGFDVLTGAAVDGSGNLWVSGFSLSPTALSPRAFDLALWKFAPDGQTLLAGPFTREGYLSDFDTSELALVSLSSGTVYVTAPRGRVQGGTDLAFLSFSAQNGQLLSESAWRANDGSATFPSALLPQPPSQVLVAGGFDYGDGTLAGLWGYGPNGSLMSAQQANAGGARGAVFSGANLWMSVDGSTTPFMFAGSTSAAGAYADIEPPRTSVGASAPSGVGAILYAGIGSEFYLTAVDDAYAVGDGLGTGPIQTFLSIDTSSFTVYASSFTLAEGSHTLQYYSVDASGNAEVIESTTVAADDTPPVTNLQVVGSTLTDSAGIVLVSSNTIFSLSAVDPVSNGVASGVAATYYVIDQDPFSPACEATPLDPTQPNGTCANEIYDSSFTIAVGTHTLYFFSEDVAGNQEAENVVSFTVVYTLNDTLPPRTSLVVGPPSFSSGTLTYVTSVSTLGFVAVDDAQTVGDGLGVGAATTYVSLNGRPFNVYSGGTKTISTEGFDTISYYSVDLLGNAEAIKTSTVAVDNTPPITTLLVLGSSSTDVQGRIDIAAATALALSAVDPISNGVASGVARTGYLLDNSSSITVYAGPFQLAVGTHTLTYLSIDNVGNREAPYISSFSVAAGAVLPYALNPSTGPIGVPFAISGPGGFGSYAGTNTQVFIGTTAASLSVWNDTNIQGTIPSLSLGSYAVTLSTSGSGGPVFVANFSVTALSSATLTTTSGPIGSPFNFTGSGFGPYASALTTVLIGGTTAPLSVWNDTTISGNIPFVSSGTEPIVIQRAASNGGLETSAAFFFTVTVPTITAVSPSSGPIGVAYTLSGQNFGSYAGALTQVLIGGTTTALSVWNNTTISGAVPGGLAPGIYPVVAQIAASGGGLVQSNTAYFQVAGINLVSVAPSSGPIGVTYSLSGAGFGAYAGANTQVLIGGTTTALSVWNDTNIQGTIPALSTGAYSLVVERSQGASMAFSAASTFTITALSIGVPMPSSGPVGATFTLSGSGFGAYAGTATQVLIGGATVPLSVWNDTTITGTVPTLAAGSQPLWIERFSGSGLQTSNTVYYAIVTPAIASISPSSGAIGVPFSLAGAGFGAYGGANTQVLVGGVAAPLSVWNDQNIQGTIPALSTGNYGVAVERIGPDGTAVLSSSVPFQVVGLSIFSLTPSSSPIGAPFTITGSGFGPYGGSATSVTFNGIVAPLSVWNDTTVSGNVPGALAVGAASVVLSRSAGTSVVSSTAPAFLVVVPVISSITPNAGTSGDGVMVSGFGFGPYQGSATQLLVGGTAMPLSVWNDQEIVWTVPSSLSNGTDPVVVSIAPSGGSVQSSSVAFTVTGNSGGGNGPDGIRPAFSVVSKPAVSPASQPDFYFQGDLVFSTNSAAVLTTPSGAALNAPVGALAKKSELTIQRPLAASLSAANAALTKQGLAPAGSPVEFGPSGLAFPQPVSITLPYDPTLVNSTQLSGVAIYYFNPAAGEWAALPTQVVAGQYALATQTSHFSLYQPLHVGPITPAITPAELPFGLRAAYAFPNPARGAAATVDFRLQVGETDSVDLHVYGPNGRRVLSTTLGAASVIDDGNGLGPQLTYDYVWSAGGAGNGVYRYVFVAHKRGRRDVTATGRAAVVR